MLTDPRQPPQIPMQPLDSSHLAAAGHDEGSATLQIAFKDQSMYHYYGVRAPVYQALLDAKSKGSYFNQNIKGKFKSLCVMPKPKKEQQPGQ